MACWNAPKNMKRFAIAIILQHQNRWAMGGVRVVLNNNRCIDAGNALFGQNSTSNELLIAVV